VTVGVVRGVGGGVGRESMALAFEMGISVAMMSA
jgi:hypothetical protein